MACDEQDNTGKRPVYREQDKTVMDNGYRLSLETDLDMYFSDVTNIKPMAMIYIDDRALKFEGDYNKTFNQIKNFNVYWRK